MLSAPAVQTLIVKPGPQVSSAADTLRDMQRQQHHALSAAELRLLLDHVRVGSKLRELLKQGDASCSELLSNVLGDCGGHHGVHVRLLGASELCCAQCMQ
jgi:ubiquinone biosynthesis protein UbiJ